jgi:hypothetical protein
MGMYINNLRNGIYNIFITVILKYKERFTGKEYWLVFSTKNPYSFDVLQMGRRSKMFFWYIGTIAYICYSKMNQSPYQLIIKLEI